MVKGGRNTGWVVAMGLGCGLHGIPLDILPHGVTFLAFGNGAPDIFSALVAFSDPRTAGLAIGALFGEHSLIRVWRYWGIAQGVAS